MSVVVVGERVRYAGAPYVVVAVHGDLLVLDGIVTSNRRVRPRCTVLVGDVERAP